VSITRRLTALLFAATLLAALGCRAQTPAAATPAAVDQGTPLTPEQAHRVEVLVRQRAGLPPGSAVHIGGRTPSDVAGFDSVSVTISNEGNTSRPIKFLLSTDSKTLAQFSKFDISADPRSLVSADNRPFRGGPLTAPVLFVNFDDLECPYCARFHASIFPALTERYGDKIRIVYKDFPLEQHPWAMHAAVDANCMAEQSAPGYWSLLDGIHAHSADITEAAEAAAKSNASGPVPPADEQAANAKALARAFSEVDKLTLEQGKVQQVDLSKLNACIVTQDKKAIEASVALGTSLGVESTPTFFINGAKLDGAVPLEFIFNEIDQALLAQGQKPPPPYVAPAPAATPATTPKPGQ
jgi:protein-disulfide isomerase